MTIKKILLKNFIFQNILSVLCYIYVVLVSLTSKIIHKNQDAPVYYWKNNKPFIILFLLSLLLFLFSRPPGPQPRVRIQVQGGCFLRFRRPPPLLLYWLWSSGGTSRNQSLSMGTKRTLSVKPLSSRTSNSWSATCCSTIPVFGGLRIPFPKVL